MTNMIQLDLIQLSNVRFESNQKLFNQKSKKLIRFSSNLNVAKSESFGKVYNERSIAWDEIIKVPQIYNQPIQFQICNRHEFGYNPQQLAYVLYGKITLTKSRHSGKWEVYMDQDNETKKVGYLALSYKREGEDIEKSKYSIQDKTPATILIKNLVNIPLKAYVMLYTGKKKIKSYCIAPTQYIKGEFQYNLYFTKQFQTQVKYNGIFIQFINHQHKFIGKAIFELQQIEQKLQNANLKARLVNVDGLKVGDAFLNIKYIPQENQIQKSQKMKSIKSQTKLMSKIGSVNLITQEKLPLINSKSDRRSHSILNSNSGIAVPKSERFKYPGESAKTKVSYHQGLQDFNFMNVHSGKYYKGASIGKGGKYDFTKERKSPGVGTYHIPSIFDK